MPLPTLLFQVALLARRTPSLTFYLCLSSPRPRTYTGRERERERESYAHKWEINYPDDGWRQLCTGTTAGTAGTVAVMAEMIVLLQSFLHLFLARATNIFEGRAHHATSFWQIRPPPYFPPHRNSNVFLRTFFFPSFSGRGRRGLPPLSSAFFGCFSLELSCRPLFSSLSCNSCSLVS